MIRATIKISAFAFAVAAMAAPAAAHDPATSPQVVPEAERARAAALLADGPGQTAGIAGVDQLGTVALDGEFASSDGLVMRVRELVIDPGGVVAVHQHDNRPGVAYIIEGEMTEHRSSEEGPVVKGVGDTAFERSGVVHWWENTGDAPARALVVDIVPAE